MARVKLTEFKGKTLFYNKLDLPYFGLPYSMSHNFKEINNKLDDTKKYVVKVDQGVKKRYKQGLLELDISASQILPFITKQEKNGYSQFIIEEYFVHDNNTEKYLAIERVREGYKVYMSQTGGVDIESASDLLKVTIIKGTDEEINHVAQYLDIEKIYIKKLFEAFDEYYISFLEINPLLSIHKKPVFLDLALEVDSTAEFFVNSAWTKADFVSFSKDVKTPQEVFVQELADKSQAAFNLSVLNRNGSMFLLLSGGGASVVIADELYDLGKGLEIANYGEYSGNPNEEETYLYTKQLLELLIASQSKKKALIVAGGVSNFTDVRITFRGIIRALNEYKKELAKQNVTVYVRRGGPHEKEGLEEIETFLKKEHLLGSVNGPSLVLTDIVSKAI